MRTGISTASLFMRKYNEEALPFLEKIGVKDAEVFLTSFSEYEEDFARLLEKKKGSVSVNSVHILNAQIEPQVFSACPRIQKDVYAYLEKIAKSAQILGAPYYTFHGTARYKKAAREGQDDFKRVGNALQKAFAFCKEKGVTLCLENVEWSTYNRVGVFSALKEYIPDLKGVLDIKQARIAGEGYEAYLNEMGNDIAYVHISDLDENGKIRLPGQGVFDFDTLIKRLKDVGFDGKLFIEVYKDDYQSEDELKTSCDFINERLYKYGCLH
ncbi:MAG: sugar phosphate isomerase/epimerase [Clostridia bacterium]|nr:sugar phosphate isomerase/epimerase [Clostridia bacterium]